MPTHSAPPIPTIHDASSAPPKPFTPPFSKILNNSANRPSPRQKLYTFNLATNATRIWPGTVNPRNNLAHCFSCKKNLNNIDLLITIGYDFRSAVAILEGWLMQYQAGQANK